MRSPGARPFIEATQKGKQVVFLALKLLAIPFYLAWGASWRLCSLAVLGLGVLLVLRALS